MSRFRILTNKTVYNRFLDLLIVQERPEGVFIAEPMTFKLDDMNSFIANGTIGPVQCRTVLPNGDVKIDNLDGRAFLQAAIDHAWEIGMRPSGLFDHTQEIGAIKSHLADMRALVFKTPKPSP